MSGKTKNFISGLLSSASRAKYYLKLVRIFEEEAYAYGLDGAMFQSLRNLKSFGYSPKSIIDAGAYVGDWTRQVVGIFPEAHYLMLEAQPGKRNKLEEVVNSYKETKIELEIGLLGAKNEDNMPFYLMETGSSILSEKTTYPRELTHLSMTKLDDIVEEKKLAGPFLLKLDVQGYELEVLKGAVSVLKSTDFVLMEASVIEYNEGAPLIGEMITYMSKLGYVIYDITDFRRKLPEKLLFQVDILFCREDHPVRQLRDFT